MFNDVICKPSIPWIYAPPVQTFTYSKITACSAFGPGCSGGRVVSTSVSHQCGPGSIPGWGSDPGAVSEKGFVPV